ncbi:hypothetical protein OGAPHI_003688 [Ogataea philodendri]|uniref:Uncharacterized protein n=1 Tax=Ogataea philodendri TaxID=1378263 RepID=A0A9P8P5U9_9ASCO|nr:uncharacterized protein OGAPHI_003688 [Ogataea philodendri]KAH3665502.1 hypothetical protein OGAPHI_003688 [Ogataea philodendri]
MEDVSEWGIPNGRENCCCDCDPSSSSEVCEVAGSDLDLVDESKPVVLETDSVAFLLSSSALGTEKSLSSKLSNDAVGTSSSCAGSLACSFSDSSDLCPPWVAASRAAAPPPSTAAPEARAVLKFRFFSANWAL